VVLSADPGIRCCPMMVRTTAHDRSSGCRRDWHHHIRNRKSLSPRERRVAVSQNVSMPSGS
jgi:hypothetical protein